MILDVCISFLLGLLNFPGPQAAVIGSGSVLQHAFVQCNLAATISTAVLISVVYLAVTPLVHAADESPVSQSPNDLIFSDGGQALQLQLESFNGLDVLGDLDGGLDTRGLDNLRRVPQAVSSLGNNQLQQSHIKVGETQWWYFPKEDVNGKKSNVTSGLPARIGVGKSAAQDDVPPNVHGNTKRSATVYLSLTTCSKPAVNTSEAGNPLDLPQLEVYISQSESLQKPGPGKDGSAQTVHTAHKGYMGTSLDADGDVFVGVSAPNATGYSGQYSYEIAASIDALFHSVNDEGPFLYFLDADTNAALLVTGNLTQSQPGSDNYKQWMNITPPYTMFAHNVNDTALSGLERSYCALEQHSHVSKKTHDVGASMTNRGLGNKPKEQFYVTGLNSSSFYYGILARDGNATSSGNGIVGGGGKIWKPMNFTTKSAENCAVLFDLPFCSEVAYAVPSNPSINITNLGKIYDTYAADLYQNFTYSLQQIQCNASAESMYSLAVNCTSCERAYKEWLCAVTIPRCADFSNNATYLQVRNAGQPFLNGSSIPPGSPLRSLPASNHSRNPLIDSRIQPGPYKEVLTCLDVCHTLVRTCPAALEFACPQGPRVNWSYGTRDQSGVITCNYLGAAYYLNAAGRVSLRFGRVFVMLGVFWFFWLL